MQPNLKEIAKVFFKLGATAFGGPAAHIAMMEEEIIRKRKWFSAEHFLDLIGATNLIPGPNSTEMTMHCGYERAGWKGLFVAGVCFILPAVAITMAFAMLYEYYGALPKVQAIVYGIKPAVIAIIASAVYRLGKKALKSTVLGILGGLTLIACFLGVNEIVALFSCGALGLLLFVFREKSGKLFTISPFLLINCLAKSVGSAKVFLIFLKVGALLYGGGYVLFAFLDAELVSTGLLSREDLITAIAIGQFTPGPVLSTATFIGWQLDGVYGALAATLGVFLPSFIFVLILNPIIPRLRKSVYISAFLDAVNIAAVALIAFVGIEMVQDAVSDWKAFAIMGLSLLVVFGFKKLNSAYIVLGGALLGYLLSFF